MSVPKVAEASWGKKSGSLNRTFRILTSPAEEFRGNNYKKHLLGLKLAKFPLEI